MQQALKKFSLILVALPLLAGCTAEQLPQDWLSDTPAINASKTKAGAVWPNLADVPERPQLRQTPAERQAQIQALTALRAEGQTQIERIKQQNDALQLPDAPPAAPPSVDFEVK